MVETLTQNTKGGFGLWSVKIIFLEDHETKFPPRKIQKLDMDHLLSRQPTQSAFMYAIKSALVVHDMSRP
jgi:hypothetical protein